LADFPQHLMIVFFHKKMAIRHQIITVQIKIAIFNEKRILLNVEENQPMASLCYF
jgi:hypothetical protein